MKTKIIFILLSLICFLTTKQINLSGFSNLPVKIQDPIKLTSKKKSM